MADILFEELAAASGKVGRVTLNIESTLNSLTLDMVDLLQAQLDAWRDDDSIGAIFIEGAGEKAFCAGGDVQALHASAVATPGGPCEYAEAFFTREYRMNYTLHTYPKPLICWGHGIVMGGGLGVMAGCSHRVVTERTRIAMPEVTIALFPDVGGSWFLNHMPGSAGVFLALTGASINAADAIYTGIADRFIASEHKDAVVRQLLAQSWQADSLANHSLVRHVLQAFCRAEHRRLASWTGRASYGDDQCPLRRRQCARHHRQHYQPVYRGSVVVQGARQSGSWFQPGGTLDLPAVARDPSRLAARGVPVGDTAGYQYYAPPENLPRACAPC